MPIARRDLLRTTGVTLTGLTAGCSSPGRFNTYRIEADSPPRPLPVELTVRATQGPHEKGPGRIRFTLTSIADEPQVFSASNGLPFTFATAIEQASDESGAEDRLVLTADPDWGIRRDGCWTCDRSARDDFSTDSIEDRARLSPDQTIESTCDLLNAVGNSACYPPGRYRFVNRYQLIDGNTSKMSTATWGFTLTIRSMV